MLKRLRPYLFALFVVTFFVTASSVVFYTFGYRFSFERGIFISTGSLSLKINTDPVIITIDGVVVPKQRLGLLNNSIHVTGLNPDEHFVEVGAKGYKKWSKKVVIQSGLTTEFWNVFLVKENYEQLPVPHTEQVIKLFPAPNGLLATVKKSDNRYSVEIIDPKAEESEEVFATTTASFSPQSRANIEWSPESHKLCIPLLENGHLIYIISDITTKKSLSLNDLAQTKTTITDVRWDATAKNFLFFLNQGALYRIDSAEIKPLPILVKNQVAAYDISGRNIYYLSSENGIVYQIPASSTDATPKQITPTPLPIEASNTYTLITYNKEYLAVINHSSGKLFVYNKQVTENPLKAIGQGIQGVQYSDDGKKLLFYSDNEASVYFNQDWQAQPMRAMDSIIQIARFSSSIHNVLWSGDYEHILFTIGQNVKIAELDSRDRRDFADLLTFDTPLLQVLPRFNEGTLYVVRTLKDPNMTNNTVTSVSLISPSTNLFGL